MKLSNYFEKVFVINLINRKDRRDSMINMFQKMGLQDDLMDGTIEFYPAVKMPFMTPEITDYLNNIGATDVRHGAGSQYNFGLFLCSIEHYRLMRIILEKGYKKVLILEDDARFIKDNRIIERSIETMPSDFKCCHFEGYFWSDYENYPLPEDMERMMSINKYNGEWKPSNIFHMYGAAALAWTREGIQDIVNMQNEHFEADDWKTFIYEDHSYFYSVPIVIQEDKFYSDIINQMPDTIRITNGYLCHADINDYYKQEELIN